MTKDSISNPRPDKKVVEGVVTLLCQHAATHSDFFECVVDEMGKHGYTIECHQRGIHGTYLCVAKLPPNSKA